MKKINFTNKFNSFYYIGLSAIISVIIIVVVILSILSGLIIKSINNYEYNRDSNKVENVTDTITKKIHYDTVKVRIYDTIKVYPKKTKPLIQEQVIDTANIEKSQL